MERRTVASEPIVTGKRLRNLGILAGIIAGCTLLADSNQTGSALIAGESFNINDYTLIDPDRSLLLPLPESILPDSFSEGLRRSMLMADTADYAPAVLFQTTHIQTLQSDLTLYNPWEQSFMRVPVSEGIYILNQDDRDNRFRSTAVVSPTATSVAYIFAYSESRDIPEGIGYYDVRQDELFQFRIPVSSEDYLVLSPTNSEFLILRQNGTLGRMNVDSNIFSEISRKGIILDAAYSLDGEHIAISEEIDGVRRIVELSNEGPEEKSITTGPNDTNPLYSPGGEELAFFRESQNDVYGYDQQDLYIYSRSTGEETLIKQDVAEIAFNIDGTIYIHAFTDRHSGIDVIHRSINGSDDRVMSIQPWQRLLPISLSG